MNGNIAKYGSTMAVVAILISAGCGERTPKPNSRLAELRGDLDRKTSDKNASENIADSTKSLQDKLGAAIADNIKLRQEMNKPPQDISKVPPAYSLTAEELFREWKQNEDVFAKKYAGTVVEISGVVGSLDWRSFSGPRLSLRSGEKYTEVMCMCADPEPWSRALPGQKVKLKGTSSAPSSSGPVLLNAILLEVDSYQGIAMTVDELAKEYAADSDATNKKYEGKYLSLTGETIAKIERGIAGVEVLLKTTGNVRVKFAFNGTEEALFDPIAIGQNTWIVVPFDSSRNSKDNISFYGCLPVKQK